MSRSGLCGHASASLCIPRATLSARHLRHGGLAQPLVDLIVVNLGNPRHRAATRTAMVAWWPKTGAPGYLRGALRRRSRSTSNQTLHRPIEQQDQIAGRAVALVADESLNDRWGHWTSVPKGGIRRVDPVAVLPHPPAGSRVTDDRLRRRRVSIRTGGPGDWNGTTDGGAGEWRDGKCRSDSSRSMSARYVIGGSKSGGGGGGGAAIS